MNSRVCLVCLSLSAGLAFGAGGDLAFKPDGANGFRFDTGVLRGTLRGGGKSKGLSSVEHVPTGTRLDRGMGLLGHYRVFTANHRYGSAAWDWPSDAKLRPDGSVEVVWSVATDRPFEMRAIYQIAASNAVEVETTVIARASLLKFESFLASYFSSDFTNALVFARAPDGPTPGKFMTAEEKYGTWLVFPRDAQAMEIVRDGRWTIPPSPVDWVPMPAFAAPIAIRRSPSNGLAALLMSTSRDCFAVLTPHQNEAHYSMYFSQLGRDLKPAETARSRVRLVIQAGLTESTAEKIYEDYAAKGALGDRH